jgi:carboxypeptidase C (cathepsin A)
MFYFLSAIKVESAGHMVPIDQPAASAAALQTITSKFKKQQL